MENKKDEAGKKVTERCKSRRDTIEPIEEKPHGYWKRVDNEDGTQEVVFIKVQIKKMRSSRQLMRKAS